MSAEPPFNDRVWVLEQRETQRQQQQTLDEAQHYQRLGIGLAVLCQAFWETLGRTETVDLTRDEKMRLLEAALQGR